MYNDWVYERTIQLAQYILDTHDTVRGAAKKFGISKSTVHKEVTITNGSCGWWHKHRKTA